MINYYRKSRKIFKRKIKENPNITKEEWDKYAQENCLFSANTIRFHYNVETFQELKKRARWF